jgi:cytoskeletal protein CcmA (bactofilin family)
MGSEDIKTIIAEDIEIVGSIKSASNIQLAGKLNGDLTCTGNAVIGETASVKGNITANSTTVKGQINGNVTVKDRIELCSTARLNGDIRSKRLSVEDGATFVGKSEVNPTGNAQPRPSDGKQEESVASSGNGDGSDAELAGKARGGAFAKK